MLKQLENICLQKYCSERLQLQFDKFFVLAFALKMNPSRHVHLSGGYA